jgi:hypothetical protein
MQEGQGCLTFHISHDSKYSDQARLRSKINIHITSFSILLYRYFHRLDSSASTKEF